MGISTQALKIGELAERTGTSAPTIWDGQDDAQLAVLRLNANPQYGYSAPFSPDGIRSRGEVSSPAPTSAQKPGFRARRASNIQGDRPACRFHRQRELKEPATLAFRVNGPSDVLEDCRRRRKSKAAAVRTVVDFLRGAHPGAL